VRAAHRVEEPRLRGDHALAPRSDARRRQWQDALSVCIPKPLAGDDACGNGPRFFHSSVDMKSTQPLEQMLGTLAQTEGYKLGEERGGEPWKQALRANATKTLVVVTDDNSRLTAGQFETFPGGTNPYNAALVLPPGLLDPSWNGLFSGY